LGIKPKTIKGWRHRNPGGAAPIEDARRQS
jgi:hypothetical protein